MEAVHVQRFAPAPARRRRHADARRVGPQGPRRPARGRGALREGAAAGAARSDRRRRTFRGDGKAGRAGKARRRVRLMHLMYFTEQPMSAYDAQAGLDFGATALMLSNRHFDPVAGSRLYNEYLEHYRLAEEVGLDGIMLHEHHHAPLCTQAKSHGFASILAAMTRRA